MSETGVSASYVDSKISALRTELKNHVNTRIEQLMSEITTVGRQLENAINRQTDLIYGGVIATTAAVESTKVELSDKLSLQLRSEIQIELGRKLNVARSASSKLKTFLEDIRSRFEKSVQAVFINRNEYDERFNQILDEYSNKIKTIGEHIFQIRDEIRLAEASCSHSLEQVFSLPIEVDLYRLDLRSQELDETVEMLELSRLNEIKTSLEKLEKTVQSITFEDLVGDEIEINLEALYVSTTSNDDVFIASNLMRGSIGIDNTAKDDPSCKIDSSINTLIKDGFSQKIARALTNTEYAEMNEAINTLFDDGILSRQDAEFARLVINSKKLLAYN